MPSRCQKNCHKMEGIVTSCKQKWNGLPTTCTVQLCEFVHRESTVHMYRARFILALNHLENHSFAHYSYLSRATCLQDTLVSTLLKYMGTRKQNLQANSRSACQFWCKRQKEAKRLFAKFCQWSSFMPKYGSFENHPISWKPLPSAKISSISAPSGRKRLYILYKFWNFCQWPNFMPKYMYSNVENRPISWKPLRVEWKTQFPPP